MKMMFLLFFDDIKSERELMEVIGERLDYLWFLDYGLDQKIPDHSVLSKARARWSKEVFESLFVRTVVQCVEAGLVDGSKLHVDASLVDADAAKESVIKGTPELITALKRAYRATESKLEESSTPGTYQAVNDRMMSKSDPDAALVRKGGGDSRPRYQNHRVIDDQKGVVTATETTPGSIAENKKLTTLIEQHQSNTRSQVQTVVADHKYGTAENFVACHGRTVQRHEKQALLDVARLQANSRAAWRNRRRRQHLIERSFADAANNHHFKRARWRRLWRQQIQDYLIAAVQNVRILLAHQNPKPSAAAALLPPVILTKSLLSGSHRAAHPFAVHALA